MTIQTDFDDEALRAINARARWRHGPHQCRESVHIAGPLAAVMAEARERMEQQRAEDHRKEMQHNDDFTREIEHELQLCRRGRDSSS